MAERQALPVPARNHISVQQHSQTETNPVLDPPEQDIITPGPFHLRASWQASNGVAHPTQLDPIPEARLSLLELK